VIILHLKLNHVIYKVTTCIEKLKMPGVLTAVSKMSGILLKVTEV